MVLKKMGSFMASGSLYGHYRRVQGIGSDGVRCVNPFLGICLRVLTVMLSGPGALLLCIILSFFFVVSLLELGVTEDQIESL